MKQFIIPIEMKEFKNLLREAVREEIQEVLDAQQYEPFIKTEEACQLLGVTKVTLLAWRKQGLIPCHKINSRVFYKRSELLAAASQLPNGKGRRK